jgi:hypothetical protein
MPNDRDSMALLSQNVASLQRQLIDCQAKYRDLKAAYVGVTKEKARLTGLLNEAEKILSRK